MELADLNSSADDARLEALLQKTAPLADDGFSRRVLAALPPPALTPVNHAARRFLLGGGTLVGVSIAVLGFLRGPATPVHASALAAEFSQAVQPAFDPMIGVAVLVTALSLLYVFRPRFRWNSYF